MTSLTDHQTDAALAEPWPFPQPVQFAGVEPAEPADAATDWPIARITVDALGYATKTVMYTPSLPEGEHDVWCIPVDAAQTIATLQEELAAARQQIDHLNRLALRARNAQAGR